MLLKCNKVSKSYGDNKALQSFSYDFTPGVYGLLGPNGAGKSTLMNIITDNLKQTEGNLLYDEKDIHELGRDYRRKIGYVPQQQQVFPGFTLRRFLLYVSGLKGIDRKTAAKQISDIVSKVNLEDVMDRKLSTFSGGMKQRALLAQALLGEPSVIILDEPTAGLDPNERIRFRNIVSKIAFDRIVIIATHVVSDIQFIANKVLIMKSGRMIMDGTPWELCEGIRGKVFEIQASEEELAGIETGFRVADMIKDRECIRVRVVSDRVPYGYMFSEKDPSLEDVYLYRV
ncbi:MAG: ATP-binding cassette domain-containing protein [Lachnospiraceae bacterium]|nr:ATP-binding cassette domain-containing protein [Lachnospiraceae bacterium]